MFEKGLTQFDVDIFEKFLLEFLHSIEIHNSLVLQSLTVLRFTHQCLPTMAELHRIPRVSIFTKKS